MSNVEPHQSDASVCGFSQLRIAFSDVNFWDAALRTILYFIGTTVIILPLSLVLALLLQDRMVMAI